MDDLILQNVQSYELTKSDRFRAGFYTWGALSMPVLVALPLPVLFIVFYFLFPANPALWVFLALISGAVGFLLGIILGMVLYLYGRSWLKNLREKMAADGIKTEEIPWFMNELTSAERKSLKELKRTNRLLADAFQETLASRLTASRILRNTKQELQLVGRRENKIKYLKRANSEELVSELKADRERLEKIRTEAEELKDEAEARLQMIEAAAHRGTQLSGSEIALQRLQARTEQLPFALEAARMEEEVRKELEQ
jgi:DNA repair exonuclease SbcCD ATPase subunit